MAQQSNTTALMAAVLRKDATALAYLISLGATDKNGRALQWAAEHACTACVGLLIPVSDPKANNSMALRLAADNGCADCVKLLIPVSDPQAGGGLALEMAAFHGHTQCVILLIPVVDPKTNNSAALRYALLNGHNQCVDKLWAVSNPDDVLAWISIHKPHAKKLWQVVHAQQQHQILTAAADTEPLNVVKRVGKKI